MAGQICSIWMQIKGKFHISSKITGTSQKFKICTCTIYKKYRRYWYKKIPHYCPPMIAFHHDRLTSRWLSIIIIQRDDPARRPAWHSCMATQHDDLAGRPGKTTQHDDPAELPAWQPSIMITMTTWHGNPAWRPDVATQHDGLVSQPDIRNPAMTAQFQAWKCRSGAVWLYHLWNWNLVYSVHNALVKATTSSGHQFTIIEIVLFHAIFVKRCFHY